MSSIQIPHQLVEYKGLVEIQIQIFKRYAPRLPPAPRMREPQLFRLSHFKALKRYHFYLYFFFIVRGVMRNTAGGNEGTVTLSHAKAHNSRELHIDGTHRKLRGLWP